MPFPPLSKAGECGASRPGYMLSSWQRIGLYAVFFAAPIIAYLAALGMWAPWVVLLILMTVGFFGHKQGSVRPVWGAAKASLLSLIRHPFAWFLLLPVLGVLSAPWSLVPGVSAQRSLVVLVQVGGALGVTLWLLKLPDLDRYRLVALAGVTSTIVGCILLLDVGTGAHLAILIHHRDTQFLRYGGEYSRGAVVNAILLFPACVALWKLGRHWGAGVLLVVTLVALQFTMSEVAALASVLAFAVGALLFLLPRLIVLVPVAVIIVQMGIPFVVSPLERNAYCSAISTAPTLAHRFVIWHAVSDLVMEKPVMGWGVDSARAAPGGKTWLILNSCDEDGVASGPNVMEGEMIPLHPHNGALEIWFCLGALGAVFSSLALWRVFALARRTWPDRMGALTVGAFSCTALLIFLIGFSIWQAWFEASLCFGIACVALLAPRDTAETADKAL